jgi:hypothetical protein
MAKLRVRKHAQLLYPDGSVRGGRGYIVDTNTDHDRDIVADQGDVLEPVRERSAVASPVDMTKMGVPAPAGAPPSSSKKKAKKKATKKKTSGKS